MLYIHQSTCISSQHTFGSIDIEALQPSLDGRLHITEPTPPAIPAGVLRRMGKAVKMSVTCALPLLERPATPEGIIIGTGNGGMEDSIQFLNQIIQYEEGMLTPGNFVQSTANAMAAQISMLTANRCYNTTHVHRGLAFENALLDAVMQASENSASLILLGAVDEISTYNDNIERLAGGYKEGPVTNHELYTLDTPGSIAGEGAVMFLVSGNPAGANTAVPAIRTLHTTDEAEIKIQLIHFLDTSLPAGETVDWFLSGENGDNRLLKYYTAAESVLSANTGIARFKHMSGEYPTAVAMACWLACHIIETGEVPIHMRKRPTGQATAGPAKNVLIYNNYKGKQHSFILVSRPGR